MLLSGGRKLDNPEETNMDTVRIQVPHNSNLVLWELNRLNKKLHLAFCIIYLRSSNIGKYLAEFWPHGSSENHFLGENRQSVRLCFCQVLKVTSKRAELKADVWPDLLSLKQQNSCLSQLETKLFVSVGPDVLQRQSCPYFSPKVSVES